MRHISNLFLLFVTTFVAISSSFAQSGWVSQSSGTANLLIGVSFTDANTGTAVGNFGTIAHTTNSGATWTSQTSGTTNSLCCARRREKMNLLIAASGTLLRAAKTTA